MNQESSEKHNAQWYERQYDPRPSDGSLVDILADWSHRSEKFRATPMEWETISYGKGERTKIDIYRATKPRGVLLFYHGGYWRSCSKDEHGWVAQAFREAGLSVAVINYPLCPEVTLQEIVMTIRQAFITLYQKFMTEEERAGIVVTGHSAGAYLAATHLVTDWTKYGIPAPPVKCMICISGLFDLVPLINTSMNSWLHLTPAIATELSLINRKPYFCVPSFLCLGTGESEEFHRQSITLAQNWDEMPTEIIDVNGMNHFDVLDDFASTEGGIYKKILSLIETWE